MNDPSKDSGDPRAKGIVHHLESLQRAGVTHLPKSGKEPGSNEGDPEMAQADSSIDSLPVIAEEVAACTRCPELVENRTQTVFGTGNPHARLCFLGEAPGADEDKQGEPFVGRAGKLLTDIIEKGMNLRREDVYILNILKCRPPGNRNPTPDEAKNCSGFLDRQLALLQPEFICCLGAVAAQNLLETTTPIGKLRGQLHSYGDIRVVC
ncbi:MAG: uracil-DNA glycosylase, partial [Planctomycetales bacterium]